MGVSNAEEIVTAALTEKYAELAYQKWMAENASYDFANATVDDINSISLEGAYADTTRQKIALYTLQKQLSNQTTIYTGDDIENLKALALAAGAGSAAVVTMGEALEAMEHNKDNRFFTNDPSASCVTSEMVDLTNVKSITAIFSAYIGPVNQGSKRTTWGNGSASLVVTRGSGATASGSTSFSTGSSNKAIVVDVSGLSGNYLVQVNTYAFAGSTTNTAGRTWGSSSNVTMTSCNAGA